MTITAAERALFPHSKLLLPRAVEALTLRLRQQDPHHIGVTPRELIDMFAVGSIAICYDWGSSGLFVPDIDDARMLNERYLSHLSPGDIPTLTAHKYGSNEPPVVMKIPHGSPNGPYDFDLEDFTWEKMVLPQTEMVKAHRLLNPQHEAPVDSINNYAERHAANREQLYKVAIGVLADYPNECRGQRKEFSPEKWRNAILAHAKEYPPLMITGPDTIKDHLAAAVNIKQRSGVKKGE
ncbi:hypothetical protein Q2T70_09670 [Klebsiella oxytoca]|uniref:hypothetical protein n=1 Tax=Klebsiella oxytoca TaxID=571 RepID=UPI00265EDE6B|nr:hypothetical protein [Klebsiella oxytoca]WKM73960.1 hypothetical protein Q2T70_09670 [Klebsiella oxytoca]